MDNFVKHYLTTALWAETNSLDDTFLDDNHSIEDISEEVLDQAKKDCESFKQKAGNLIDGLDESQVAHDFWLTRNGHGAGFWDGDYEKDLGEKLTKISKEFKEVYLYVGNDKKIHS